MAWLVSYSDLLTLLLTFFVISLTMMHEQEDMAYQNINRIMEATETAVIDVIDNTFQVGDKKQVGDLKIPPAQNVFKQQNVTTITPDLSQGLANFKNGLVRDSTFRIRKDTKGIRITISSAKIFDVNKAEIRKEFMNKLFVLGEGITQIANLNFIENLADISDLLKKNNKTFLMKIRVEGHTDNQIVIKGKYKNNLELSTARAVNVARFFHNEFNLPFERLSAEGRGEFEPIVSNNTREGRALNRRVEIYIDADLIDIGNS